jgi:UDP-glucuronate 4-epimerase
MKVLITGVGGFIGSSLAKALLDLGNIVYGIDNFDKYYSKEQKLENIKYLNNPDFTFLHLDILEINKLKVDFSFDVIIHLAAKAGVRNSIKNPISYFKNNVEGTIKVLDYAVKNNVEKVIFASSSSVYGENKRIPWNEESELLPISPYACSKISCENLGYTYSKLHNIKFISLRFFTVYGPKQRPDLAIHKFVKKISNNEEIEIYGTGDTFRDYTYISDIIEGIIKSIEYEGRGFEIFNLGNNKTISLLKLISTIEEVLGKNAFMKFLPHQPGDAPKTFADISKSKNLLGYSPKTNLKEGIENFYKWYKTENS